MGCTKHGRRAPKGFDSDLHDGEREATYLSNPPMNDPKLELDTRIARLDALIAERDDAERGLGLRLALGLAREISNGTPPGAETSEMVARWVADYGSKVVDEAVAQASALLRDPARLAAEIGKRLDETRSTEDLSGAEDIVGATRA